MPLLARSELQTEMDFSLQKYSCTKHFNITKQKEGMEKDNRSKYYKI